MMALFESLLKTGAPWGILCAVLLFGVWVLWRRLQAVSDKLIELSLTQVKVNTETRIAMEETKHVLTNLLMRQTDNSMMTRLPGANQ